MAYSLILQNEFDIYIYLLICIIFFSQGVRVHQIGIITHKGLPVILYLISKEIGPKQRYVFIFIFFLP